jgi:hypothetical protein
MPVANETGYRQCLISKRGYGAPRSVFRSADLPHEWTTSIPVGVQEPSIAPVGNEPRDRCLKLRRPEGRNIALRELDLELNRPPGIVTSLFVRFG